MISRNADATGDILPVVSPKDLVDGTKAVAVGLADHLKMFTGEWWEDPGKGNGIFDLIAGERVTEKQIPALCSYVSAYVMKFPGVQQVSDAHGWITGNQFHYEAVAHLSSGEETEVRF